MADLKSVVEKHTVRFEVWPHYDMHGEAKVMNGFDLELHGTHDHGHTKMSPGCHFCSETYRDLVTIADAVLPKDERPTEYAIQPFDASIHYEPRRKEGEVVLAIQIQHRHGYLDPVDACEEKCLAEIMTNLRQLGISGGRGHGSQSYG